MKAVPRFALIALIALAALAPLLPLHAQNAPMSAQDLVTLPRLGDAAASPDGRWVVYAVSQTDPETYAKVGRLIVRDLTDGDVAPVPLAIAGSPSAPAFGADGQLYFLLAPEPDGDADQSAAKPRAQIWRARVADDGTLVGAAQVTQVAAPIAGFLLSPDAAKIALFGQIPLACADFGCETDGKRGPGSGLLFRSDSGAARNWDSYETPGEFARIFVFDLIDGIVSGTGVAADGGLALDSPVPPFGGKEDLSWGADARTLFFAAVRPGAMGDETLNSDIYRSDLNGAAPANLTGANRAFDGAPAVSPDGRWLAYLASTNAGSFAESQRIRLVSLADGTLRELATDVDRSFDSLVWTRDSRWLLATASDTLDTPLFRIEATSGAYEKLDLIPGNEAHIAAPVALADDRLLFTRDSAGSPAELYLSTGWQQAMPLTDVATSRVGQTASVMTRRFSFAGADGATVWGQIHRPEKASGPLPAILYVHGGPHGTFGDAWSYRWNPRLVASQGYAVVSVDFHGSNGYGQAFTESIHGDWGSKPLEDLQKGLAAAIALDPQIDGDSACAMGGSYGGYMMNWIAGNWSERFRCLVGHAGVFDMRSMYYASDAQGFVRWETGGGEPWDEIAGYELRNPANYVKNWRTPMLVVTGERDFRVPYTQSIAAYNALLARGIPAELLVFPDENHWVLKPENSLQWHAAVFAWLARWLKPAE